MGPRTSNIKMRLMRQRDDDERGAELIEFAIVVVLLITLLYGIITFGVILAAQSTITQAAADGARSGIVSSSTPVATAEAQACGDLGWMDKSCGGPVTFNTTNCTFSPNPAKVVTAFACEMQPPNGCPSNTSNTCLMVTVTYNYSSQPALP